MYSLTATAQPRELIRCAIYTRKSVERGLEKEVNSLEAQRDICSAYIRSQRHRGWVELDKHYDDGGKTGANLDRPALQELLTDIEASRVDVVVIYKIDRLTRSLTDFVRLLDAFDSFGVSFTSITQSFDTSDSMGRLVLNVLLTFAQFERELMSDRLRDKFAALRRKGKWSGGCPPFGYDLVEGKLLINDAEAEHVRGVFARYPEAVSGNQLMKSLRAEGVRSKIWTTRSGEKRGGFPFGSGLLHRLVTNPIYVGYLAHEGQWYEGEHEAIVSREAWDRVQAVRQSRHGNQILREPRKHILLGLLFDCHGRRMKVTGRSNQHGSYRYYVSERTRWGERRALKELRCDADEAENLIMAGLQCFFRDRSALSTALSELGQFDANVRKALDAGDVASGRLSKLDLRGRRFLFEALLRRVELDWDHVRLVISCFELSRLLAWDGLGSFKAAAVAPKSQVNRTYVLKLPATIVRESGLVSLPLEPSQSLERGKPNRSLISLIEQAREAQRTLYDYRHLSIKELARRQRRGPSFYARLVRLNYLAPDIVTAILDGRQPPTLTRRQLAYCNLPMDWSQQRSLLGFPSRQR